VEESCLRNGIVAETGGANAEQNERQIIVGLDLQLLLEKFAGLRITGLAIELERGITQQCVRARILWIELDGVAKLSDGLLRKMGYGVGAAEQNVEGGGISHGRLQFAEELGGFRDSLGSQEGDAEKICGLKIVLQSDGFLQLGNGSVDVAIEEEKTAESVMSASIVGMRAEHGLNHLGGFVGVALAEPSDTTFQV